MALLVFESHKCKSLDVEGMEKLLKSHIPLGCNWSILRLEVLLKERNEPQTTP